MTMNEAHRLLLYAGAVYLLENNINNTKENRGTLIDPSTEVGLKLNIEETKCVL
jgi:hypothetical protein